MQLIEIDHIDPESLQAGFGAAQHFLTPPMTDFSCNKHSVTNPINGAPHHLFRAVMLGRVDQGRSEVDRLSEQLLVAGIVPRPNPTSGSVTAVFPSSLNCIACSAAFIRTKPTLLFKSNFACLACVNRGIRRW